jgi:hypothetical protein
VSPAKTETLQKPPEQPEQKAKESKKGSKPVTVESKLRKSKPFRWFEDAAVEVKQQVIQKKRDEKKAKGKKLTSEELTAIADKLAKIQEELNPRLAEHESLSEQLLAHWGHTGIEEVESAKGKTLITTSMSLCVDPDPIEEDTTPAQWRAVTKRTLNIPALLLLGQDDEKWRGRIGKAISATNVRISVVPPGSRRPKSGETSYD